MSRANGRRLAKVSATMGDDFPNSLIALVALVLGVLFLPAAIAAFYAAQDLLGWVWRDRKKPERRGFEPIVRNPPADEP